MELIRRCEVKTHFYHGKEKLKILHENRQDFKSLIQFNMLFEKYLFIELEKTDSFFQYKLMDCLLKWRQLRQNTDLLEKCRLDLNFGEMSS
jgi:hypothetical protein